MRSSKAAPRGDSGLPAPLCVRCPDVTLRTLDGTPEISFFECPSCGRHFTQNKRGALILRWRRPFSPPLYCVLFSQNAVAEGPRVAKYFADRLSSAEREAMAREIEVELEHPTQQVRDIHHNPQSEDECRKFLAAFTKQLRQMP